MNVKKNILILFALFILTNANTQEIKNLNWIIMVDDKVDLFYTTPSIVSNQNGVPIKISSTYIPGDLSVDKKDFQILTGDNSTIHTITITYYPDQEKSRTCIYNIELSRKYFEESFVVLRIYNLDKRKYRRMFEPLGAGLNYTFEIDSPTMTMKRIRKK